MISDRGFPTPISDAEIHDHVGKHLAKFKSLTGGIRRVDSIPKSAAGKILKKHLREAAAQEASEQESIKHVEQPVPIDKNYFDQVEHGPGDGKRPEEGENNHNTSNGTADTKEANGKTVVAKESLNGHGSESKKIASTDKKRKHNEPMISDGTPNGTPKHKRGKSGNMEWARDSTRKSTRINGKT